MKTLAELQAEKSHQIRCAEDIMANLEEAGEIISAADQEAIDAHLAKAKSIDAEISRHTEHETRRSAIAREKAALESASATIAPPQEPSSTPGDFPRISFKLRSGKLKAFRNDRDGEAAAYKSGLWLMAHVFSNAAAARKYETTYGGIQNALSEGVNTAGGYLVPDEMNQAIIDLREEYGVFRRECEVMPMGRDALFIARRSGGVTATFAGENAALTESDPAFDNVQLVAKKLGVMTRISTELAEDAVINIADWVSREFAYAFALKEDQCGFIGDGTSTYGGITGALTKFNNNTSLVGSVAAPGAANSVDAFSEIDAASLATVMGKLPQYAHRGAKWYCSQLCFDLVFSRLAVASGGTTMQMVNNAFAPSYLGYPIVTSQVLPASTSTDYSASAMLMFGRLDLAATLGERRGITVAKSDDRYFDSDQIAIRATSRFDIVVHDVGDTTNAGPLVALMGN